MILRHPAIRASWLAIIAGLADGIGWLQTGLFAAQMTGNTALLGVALAERHWHGAWQKAAAILCFLSGTLVARLLLQRQDGRRGQIPAVMVASLIILVAAYLARPVNVLLLGAALGAQNAAFARFGGQNINTSFVSGDLQKLAQVIGRSITRRPTRQGDRVVLITVPSLWLAYVAGAAFGVLCQHRLALPLLVPALMLPVVLLLPKDADET